MGGISVTVSVKKDELNMIQKLMDALDLKRHQVIKLALRRFLFPTEVSKIPLDGAYAQITRVPTLEKVGDDLHRRINVTRDSKKKSVVKRVD